MGLLLLIPGLVLWLADLGLFAAEEKVGEILTAIGGGLIALQLVWILVMSVVIKKHFDRF
jgi:drug/metabolite transporter superfamily protein YnfA